MAICESCIIPENFPKIEMTEGICSFCQLNTKKFGNKQNVNREMELKTLIKNRTNLNGYECIVPISGGKDSTYILYYLVKNLDINPLAVFFDNGFTTDYAINNVKEICRKLNVKLIIKYASKYRRKIVQEAWYYSYYTGKINNFCGNCENNLRTTAINEALKHNIKIIIWGSTDYEDSPDSFLDPSAERYRDTFANRINFRLVYSKTIDWLITKENISFKSKMMSIFHRFKYIYYYIMDNLALKAPEGMGKFSPYLQVSFKNKMTETLYFYDYIPYDPFRQIKILEKEVGWKAPPDREAKMDCSIHYIQNFRELKETGITNSGFKLSVLVRNGMISREEAINKEQNEVEHIKNFFQSKNLEIAPALKVMKEMVFK